jgi:hypothetical protein
MQLEKGKWRLWKNDKELGQWDMVVIAHNGMFTDCSLNVH